MNMRRTAAALLVPVLVVPALLTPIGGMAADAEVASAPAPREPDQTASRSANRNLFLPATTTTLTAPAGAVDTTTTSTTAAPAPTTTTTAKPRPTTTTTSTTAPPAPAPAVEPPAPASGSVTDIALAQVGKAYRSAAVGPNAFDCSGLVYYVFNQAGISIPRLSSDGYYARYTKVSRDQLQPGDLVVYPGHIAIYVGNGNIVSASTPKGGVKHYGMNNPGRITGYVRIA